MTAWGEGVARARGLGTRLSSRADLVRFAGAPDVDALLRALADAGLVPGTARDPLAAERALRRRRADLVARLLRHLPGQVEVLDPVLLDEDRRAILAILRSSGEDPERTLAGLVPTPRLPEPILTTIAATPAPRTLGSTLVALGHPLGAAVLAAADDGQAAIEGAVHRAWAARVRAAARGGDDVLWEFTQDLVDEANALSARVALAHPPGARDRDVFLDGGRHLGAAAWRGVLDAPDLERGLVALRRALPGDAVTDALVGPRPVLGVLRERLRRLTHTSRLRPLTTAPILTFLLRLRAEGLDLRAVLWAVTLKLPASRAVGLLVTP